MKTRKRKELFMKKLLALLLVFVLAFSIVSCTLFSGDTNDDKNDNENGDSGDDTGNNDTGDGVELPIVDVPDEWED